MDIREAGRHDGRNNTGIPSPDDYCSISTQGSAVVITGSNAHYLVEAGWDIELAVRFIAPSDNSVVGLQCQVVQTAGRDRDDVRDARRNDRPGGEDGAIS